MIAWGLPFLAFTVILWLVMRQKGARLPSPGWLTGIFLASAAILGGGLLLSPQSPLTAEAEDQTRVDLSAYYLYTLDGERLKVADLTDRVTFINFWATWCGPCRAEMPSMATLYNSLKDDGLAMIAITDEDPETVRAYLERRPYPFPILLDPEGNLFRRLKVFALPTTVVLDQNSTILLEHEGAWAWDEPEVLEKFRRYLE